MNIYIVFACIVFFGNIYYSIPYYLKKGGVLPYIIFITVAFIVLLGLEELVKEALLLVYQLPENIEVLYGATYDKLPMKRELGLAAIYRNAVFLALSFGYRYMKDWKQTMIEQLEKKLEELLRAVDEKNVNVADYTSIYNELTEAEKYNFHSKLADVMFQDADCFAAAADQAKPGFIFDDDHHTPTLHTDGMLAHIKEALKNRMADITTNAA